MEYEIFKKIREAFESSTMSNNRFYKALKSVKWDSTFYADDEFYFIKGKLIFTTPVLNPFEKMDWRPSATFQDGKGSYIEI